MRVERSAHRPSVNEIGPSLLFSLLDVELVNPNALLLLKLQ